MFRLEFRNFLSSLFTKGFSYNTINLARSAVSAFLSSHGYYNYGTQDTIVRLMKGIFNKRPALPKYTETWDVDKVIGFIKQWPNVSDMSLKQLTLRMVMLLSLLTAQRGDAIHKIVVDDITFYEDKCVIVNSSILKTTLPKHHALPIELKSYPNECLCVVSHLKHYLKVTKDLRHPNQLLISYVKPFKPIARSTLSRWVKSVLKSAGVNTDTFIGFQISFSYISWDLHETECFGCFIHINRTKFETLYLCVQYLPIYCGSMWFDSA